MHDSPILIEVEISKEFSKKVIEWAARTVVGSPLFVCKYTKKISARVKGAIIQDGIMLLEVEIIDKNLQEGFNDIEFVVRHFIEVDPVSCLLGYAQ